MKVAAMADIGLTKLNLNRSGMDMEGNPFVRYLMEEAGQDVGLVLPKMVVMTGVYLLTEKTKYKYLPTVATAVWGVAAAANLAVYCAGGL